MFLPRTILAAAALAIVSLAASAENWPAWRGPQGDGTTSETNLPQHWSATENVKWKTPLPEAGNSTPIVWGDRIFITQAEGNRRTVMCFNRKDGKLQWEEGPVSEHPDQTHKTNPYASASPATDGERVVAWFGSAGLWCWDLAGQPLWHVDLGRQDHIWGYASSPVLHGDLCILNFGPGDRSFLVALDKKSGKEVWRHDVPPPIVNEGSGASANYRGTWATPVMAKLNGREQLVAPLQGALYGFDPKSGQEIWHCGGMNPLSYANALVAGDVVVGMGGYGGWAIGVEVKATGDLTEKRLWQNKKNSQRIGSGVVKDGLIYMVNEPGIVQCIDPKTGQIAWEERVRTNGGRSSSWSSIVASGDLLYLLTQSTDTVILKAGPKFEQIAANSLGDGLTNSSIAVSNGELFIRTHQNLWCISGGK
jgi:outer membrane protein assembly factor BamB